MEKSIQHSLYDYKRLQSTLCRSRIDHVSSNSMQLGLGSQIIAICRPNSRIEKIEIDGL